MTLQELNAADAEALRKALEECCGSSAWLESMMMQRPFGDVSQLQTRCGGGLVVSC